MKERAVVVKSILKRRVKLEINGVVQGVGFRPFVYKLARKYGLVGYVLNNGSGVVAEIEGDRRSLDGFASDLKFSAPPLSRIDSIKTQEMEPKNEVAFEILTSNATSANTMVSPDVSLCDDCRDEMRDPKNRRRDHPFINCVNCGPRYTILKKLPYDRANTSMSEFEMCADCQEEYSNPNDRRYHAQPIGCRKCGPKLKLVDSSGETLGDERVAIAKTRDLLERGKTVAIKGLGGFHLVCDATNEEAVSRLRLNKNRPTKPLAVMFKSIEEIKNVALLSQKEEELILSKERPIVIVAKKDSNYLAISIAPNIDKIGVFLPYTPLHELLLDKLDFPIVATSANLSDEPIIRNKKELFEKLSFVAGEALTHDREILSACDDGVVMSVGEKTLTLRMARGYAPKSFHLKKATGKKILALGGHQKSSMTLAFGDSMILSPHIGDLNSIDSFEYFLRTMETFKTFYDFEPDVIVCDKHPNYETTKWAKAYAKEREEVELIEVQHHYAHALACMAEYDLDEKALAFCFDGTGYGENGGLWGGEVLLASPKKYERIFHFKELSLLGGEKAAKEPKRVGLSMLFERYELEEILEMESVLAKSFSKEEIKTFHRMRARGVNSPKSSSLGRLFDGVFALSGHVEKLGYEGESGLIMESLAKFSNAKESYSYGARDGVIDWREMVGEILQEPNASDASLKFINTIRDIILEISAKYPDLPVILSGGVFQNATLVSKLGEAFAEQDKKYYIQEKTPVNDGGISLGQAYFVLCR